MASQAQPSVAIPTASPSEPLPTSPIRCGCHGALAAAGAASAKQPHPRHVGPHRRQLDAVIDHLRRLRRVGPSCGTVRAGFELGIGDAIRVRLQHPGYAGAAFARRLSTGRHVRLLAFRRWQRRIVGRLGRLLQPRQPRLKLGDARQGRLQLPDQWQQRPDQRVLPCVAQLAEINVRRHASVESATKGHVNHRCLSRPRGASSTPGE